MKMMIDLNPDRAVELFEQEISLVWAYIEETIKFCGDIKFLGGENIRRYQGESNILITVYMWLSHDERFTKSLNAWRLLPDDETSGTGKDLMEVLDYHGE